jgi:acetyl-CoA C-acetyltransferase
MSKQQAAVLGVGQTRHRSKRADVSMAGLCREAADRALQDAQLTLAEIDAVVVGKAPDLFEGVMMPELYLADALGAVGKPLLRVHTAGSVGGATGNVAASLVQAGRHQRVLAVAFEKQSESNAMWALSIAPPFSIPLVAGAGGYFAPHIRAYIRRSGAPQHIGAMVAVKDRRNGALNPYAHLQQGDITLESVQASPMLWDPVRYDETCPSSDGACAVVIGDAEAAARAPGPVAWIRATAMRTEPTMFAGKDPVNPRAGVDAAAALWRAAGITDPFSEVDVAEIYVPFSWFEPMWLENLGFAEPGTGWQLTESGTTAIGGRLPVNPSGGVLSSNPIGASGLLRFAEAALQVMGKAGAHQVDGARVALGHAYGGGSQYFSMWVVASTPNATLCPAEREGVDAVDAFDAAEPDVAVDGQVRHAGGEEGEGFLELGASQVDAQAEVHAGAERQQAGVAVGGDVEVLAVGFPVGALGADRDDGAGREQHIAVLDVGLADPRGERGDRLEAEHLLDGPRDQLRVVSEPSPLAGVQGKQAQRVGELALRGVDAALQDVSDQVYAFCLGQLVTAAVRYRQQLADQVVGGLGAAAVQQVGDVLGELNDSLFDNISLRLQRPNVKLALRQVRPLLQLRGILRRSPEDGGDGERRVRLGDRRHELACLRGPQLRQELPHHRPPPVRGPRGERRADQGTQPAVHLTGLVQDVRVDMLPQRPGSDPEEVSDLPPRERRRPRAQEELPRLPLQHDERDRRPRQPALLAGLRQLLMVGVRGEIRRAVVEQRQVKVGDRGH